MPDASAKVTSAEVVASQAARLLLDRPAALGAVRLGVVDGPSGSGKSTFAQRWAQSLTAAGAGSVGLFSSDLLATWDDPFGWWDAFDLGVLRPLARHQPGRIRVTDWTAGFARPGPWQDIPMVDVLIVEGVSCGRAAVTGLASVLVWVELPDRRRRLDRAVARDGEASRVPLTAWQHAEDAFFAHDAVRQRADFRVSG
jgi:hypothetical protein